MASQRDELLTVAQGLTAGGDKPDGYLPTVQEASTRLAWEQALTETQTLGLRRPGRGSPDILESGMSAQAAMTASPPVMLMLTPEEAALALRVGRSKVYDLMRSGKLRSVKIGGSRRISVNALAEYVAALERDAA